MERNRRWCFHHRLALQNLQWFSKPSLIAIPDLRPEAAARSVYYCREIAFHSLLPFQQSVRNISEAGSLMHISGKTCQNGSRVGEIEPLEKKAQPTLQADTRRALSQSDDSETLVEVAGVERAWGGGGTPVDKRDSAHSPEALTHMLTNLPDIDRCMLSQIVEKWGVLNDDLKRAVLAVVGCC